MPEPSEPLAVDQDDDLTIKPDVAPEDAGEREQRSPSFLWSSWDILLVIGAGGALGSLARWGVGELVPSKGDAFPWATFIENVSGGFALGVLMTFVLDVWPPSRYLRPFLGVGLLGGYTTFSTYMLESRHLMVEGQLVTAFTYLGGSLLAGLSAVWIGMASARLAARSPQLRWRRPGSVTRPSASNVDDQVRNP